MKSLNTEERNKKKKQFILFYIITIAVIVLASTAFYAPPKVVVEQVKEEIKEQPSTDKSQAIRIMLLNEQWLRLEQRRAEYNFIKSRGVPDAEVNRAKQAYNVKEAYVTKILDSMSKLETSPNSELSRLTVLYNSILSLPQIEYTTDKIAAVNDSNNVDKLNILHSQLQRKDQQIQQLLKDVSEAKKGNVNSSDKGNTKPGDAKFLNWALSSQTAAVAKLKNENAKLKAQLNDLKKYLQ